MTIEPISIVIPAHNEETVISRLLGALAEGRVPGDEIIVVCDGCTDRTAASAREFPGVRVLEIPKGGKTAALNAGDGVASRFPRFFVDADIVTTSTSLHDVASRMRGGVLAGAPECIVDSSRSSFLVRCYYAIWTQLPYVTEGGLGGSGVYGVTASGRSRFDSFPDVLCDDEFVRRLFRLDERLDTRIGRSVVIAPLTLRALIQTKTRSCLGLLQLDGFMGHPVAGHGRSTWSAVPGLLRSPRSWFPLCVYAAVRVVVRVCARWRFAHGDFGEWTRDDTTRTP